MDTPFFPTALFGDDFKEVYEPAEDTFLLLDALEKDLELIKERRPLFALEIGSGSGAVITALSKAMGSCCVYFATDLNPTAAKTTAKCAEHNKAPPINVITTNLADCLKERIDNMVDVLIFNPPYVPTSDREIPSQGLIASSWAGGKDGMRITNQFLELVPALLSKSGLCYVVIIRENDLNAVKKRLAELHLKSSITLERRCGSEHLYIFCIQHA